MENLEQITKICSFCQQEKNIDEYRKSGKRYRGECKKCEALKHKEYCKTHKEIIKKIAHKKYIKNKEKYHEKNIKNREEKKVYNQNYRKNNKEKIALLHKEYFNKNKEKISVYNKMYRETHKDKIKEYQKKDSLRRKNDPILNFKGRLRNLIQQSFKRTAQKLETSNKKLETIIKDKKLETIIGCNINELINHLIKTYENNYNEKWSFEYLKDVHVDHIKPLVIAKNKDDVINLCHYTNLQLLKKEDNLKKGKSLDWELVL